MTIPASITVLIPTPLREYSGSAAQIAVEAASVGEALRVLERSHAPLHRCVCDELGRVRRHINLFVNDDHIRERNGLDTTFVSGDVLSILPAVSGG